ncbi:myosin heavy chain, clone 203-like [Palaemon carinicauda]|uniref:myosin heavy chain, clone 203-like n=1 Tax=Palaemon carinicauda TaxID=392227 RepID=UPI0035B5C329
MEKVHGENEARVKRESKLEKEIEELKVETLCLSNRIETLQKDKENEIENFSTKMQDLQITNERLKSELSNREITIGDHLDDLTEKDHKISGLNDQLEKVHGENEARVKRELKLVKEIEDLKVETLGLSQRIETLQIEKEIEIEKFSTKLQDLQETNDHLNEELSDKDASIGEYLNKLIEMEQINLDMCDRLARVEDEKIASIHWLKSRFKDKVVEFEETIGEMKTEKERLEMSWTEARVNDLVRNGRYNCLLEELKALKEEYSHKFSEIEPKNREMTEELEKLEGEKVASIHRLESVFEKKIDELKDTIEKQLGIIGEMNTEKERVEMSLADAKMKNLTSEGNYTSSSTEMAKETIVQITKENVGLKDELLAANEITSSLKEELEGRDKKKELNRPGTRKGHVTVALDVPRKFHRAIYGVEGKTLMEITRQSGVSSIDMPRRHEYSNLITISGTIGCQHSSITKQSSKVKFEISIWNIYLEYNPYNRGTLLQGNLDPESTDSEAEIENNRNQGNRIDGPWVFGLKKGLDCRYSYVDRRDRNTILPIIIRECEQESVIHSDEWPAYSTLNSHGFVHSTINHQRHYVNPNTGTHTQSIERSWLDAKIKILRTMRGTAKHVLQSLLDEDCYRMMRKESEDLYSDFLNDIREVYR